MKYLRILIASAVALAPISAFAEEEAVQPHLFEDLNGNGISDQQEQGGEHSQPTEVEDIELPDTPPEE